MDDFLCGGGAYQRLVANLGLSVREGSSQPPKFHLSVPAGVTWCWIDVKLN